MANGVQGHKTQNKAILAQMRGILERFDMAKTQNEKPRHVSQRTTEQLIIEYQELDDLLQYGELSQEDYVEYINVWKELKRRGHIV